MIVLFTGLLISSVFTFVVPSWNRISNSATSYEGNGSVKVNKRVGNTNHAARFCLDLEETQATCYLSTDLNLCQTKKSWKGRWRRILNPSSQSWILGVLLTSDSTQVAMNPSLTWKKMEGSDSSIHYQQGLVVDHLFHQ